MHILAIFLLLIGSGEGPASSGNPTREFTDEQRIKLVVNTLESALLEKQESVIATCLSDRIRSRVAREVQDNFKKYVANAQASDNKPLVYLRTFEVKVDGNKAVAKVEAFTYGNNKRIQATHTMSFRRSNLSWSIDDAEPVNALLKQVGGIAPLQQADDVEKEPSPNETKIPIEFFKKGLNSAVPKVVPKEENTGGSE